MYNFGMPEEGAYDRKIAEERLIDQLDVLQGLPGREVHDARQPRLDAGPAKAAWTR